MTNTLTPWSVYDGQLPASSAGRIPLEKAFAMLVYDRIGFEAWELSELFSGPEDAEETGPARELVRMEAELMNREILNGKLSTFARPIGGGKIIPLKPEVWEIDEPLNRFALASFNLEQWMDCNSEPTHRIFLNEEQFLNWGGKLQRPEIISEAQLSKIFDPFGTSIKAVPKDEENNHQNVGNAVVPSDVKPCFLRLEEVLDRVGLSKSSVYDRINKGKFPAQKKLGESSRWLESEITDWIKDQEGRPAA